MQVTMSQCDNHCALQETRAPHTAPGRQERAFFLELSPKAMPQPTLTPKPGCQEKAGSHQQSSHAVKPTAGFQLRYHQLHEEQWQCHLCEPRFPHLLKR